MTIPPNCPDGWTQVRTSFYNELLETNAKLLVIVQELLDAWDDNRMSRETFCDLFSDTWRQELQAVIAKAEGK